MIGERAGAKFVRMVQPLVVRKQKDVDDIRWLPPRRTVDILFDAESF